MSFGTRFSGRVAAYVRARPSYPAALLDALERSAGLGPGCRVLDLGAGTGILTALLVERGASVTAADPNPEMLEALRQALPDVSAVAGTGSKLPLKSGAFDLVTIAQAFHWLDAQPAAAELGRVLAPEGQVAVIWNQRRLAGDSFLEGYEGLLREFGVDYAEVSNRYEDEDDLQTVFGSVPEVQVFDNAQALDLEGLKARIRSSSYMPREHHARFTDMIAAVEALHSRCADGAGEVTLTYDTKLYLGPVAR